MIETSVMKDLNNQSVNQIFLTLYRLVSTKRPYILAFICNFARAKTYKLKTFIQELPKCKITISISIKRHDHGKVSLTDIAFNPNLGGFFKRFALHWGCGGEAKITLCLKLVRIMLETWNLVLKYRYLVSEKIPSSTKTPLIWQKQYLYSKP